MRAATEEALKEATGRLGTVSTRFTHVYPDGLAPYYTSTHTARPADFSSSGSISRPAPRMRCSRRAGRSPTTTRSGVTTCLGTASSGLLNGEQYIHFESTDSGFEQVDFGFPWQNPNDQPALVNVDGYLILNGLCQVLVSGDFFGISSSLEIRTFLRIHELWNSPPTSPAPQSSQFQRALEIDLENPGPFSGGEISSENLFRGFDLQYSSFMVPPLAPEIFYANDDGEVNLVFSDQGRQVLCPGVLLTVMT